MFCVKHILADKIALPTIIFDEIDTGVSGEVALMMGEMMKFMAKNHQVISISHLPQIAARADHHYFVYKEVFDENTFSNVKLLSDDERILHVAQMIGGNEPSETALKNAQELISHG
jgi:DNA repair protein RecN (Recombination protein N)